MRTGVTLYCRVLKNGKRKFIVAKMPTATNQHPGTYYLRFGRKWECVGEHYLPAVKAQLAKAAELLDGPKQPEPVRVAPTTLVEFREAFLTERTITRKPDGSLLDADTIIHYRQVTQEFIDIIKRRLPCDITKQDLKSWMNQLRTGTQEHKAVGHRTVCNYYISIACFLHFCGVDHKKLLPRNERPSPTKEEPEIYTPTEMTKFFFNVVTERDALFFQFLLKTGAREREATHLEWSDLALLGPNHTVRFATKEGFRTKTGKFRVVPLERALADKLADWQKKNHESLVFATEKGEVVVARFLRICKQVAKRAGLDPKRFWLHKFRATFATWALRSKIDIITVRDWMGHASTAMTERYLSGVRDAEAQTEMAKMDTIYSSINPD